MQRTFLLKHAAGASLLAALPLLIALATPACANAQEGDALSMEQEQKLRHEAAHRQRRIIFNNDGGDARVPSSPITAEELIDARTRDLIGTQVDTIIYDTTAGTFGMFAHRTEAAEVFNVRDGRYEHNITPELIEQGTDPLQVMLEFAREHDFEFFWTMRMNDTHDGGNHLLLPDLKHDNPELLFGTQDNEPPYGRWSGVDYGQQRVRDLAFSYIEEVAENYDVDGIHMDFFRHSVLFKRAAWGEALSQDELDQLTDLMRRIRQRTREIGAERGRPILLAVRVPDSVEYCRAIGIDLERWLEEGLIDILVPTGYFRLNPWEYSIELARRHDVAVYPCLSETRVGGGHNRHPERASIESYRARAVNVWQARADGVYLFNMFNASHPMLHELGEMDTLLGREKVYFVGGARAGSSSADPGRFTPDAAGFPRFDVLSPDAPRTLRGDQPIELEINVGEPLAEAIEAGYQPELTLRVQIPDATDPHLVRASINGHRLSEATAVDGYIEFNVEPDHVQPGPNRLELIADESSEQGLSYRNDPPTGGNDIRITELDVDTPDPHSLRLSMKASATGQATIGTFSIRTPGRVNGHPVPPGFQIADNGYAYPEAWSHPGFFPGGEHDEDPDHDDTFAITLPMFTGEPGDHTLNIIVQNRPDPGDYYRHDKMVTFHVDEDGRVHVPRPLQDVQLWVSYSGN